MSDLTLRALSPLHRVAVPGRFGKSGAPGVVIVERAGLGIASVAARKGKSEALEAAVRDAYGIGLPGRPLAARGPAVTFIGQAPGQWLAVSERLPVEELAKDLSQHLAGLASVTDQSGGRAVVRLQGPQARDVLAKGLPIDLDPRSFATGSAATSVVGHIGVQLWQVDDAPTYDIAVFRGFAESFWSWLTASAAEFGYEVRREDAAESV